ncbi:hypothetical protein PENSUB_2416 [Penicillium subrubescens]|uniref:Zn(2)-C6 fungal-type domain-containing protein n=1 Tax=Penicillium subrubescens TaxID=1316194 RepID=A0A1Q5UHT9_9EURO|nr:hypothetical protein PENSUB_2416 [Penicillium subrubescens]
MASKKGVSTSLAEVKVKKPACAECRRRKKRCGHRDDLSPASQAIVSPASAANAADVPPAAVQVDNSIDDNNTTAVIPHPTLEGDQGRNPTTSASGADIPAVAAPGTAADTPSERRSQTRLRISKPRRPKASPPSASNNLGGTGLVGGTGLLAVNSSFARELGKLLERFESNYQASIIAHNAVLETGKDVKELVEWWVRTWSE